MSPLLKKLILVLGITLVIAAAYFLYNSQISSDVSSVENGVSGALDPDISAKTERILADTQKIRKLNLDATIFEDGRFNNLKDTRTTLVDIPTGRTNPFAPIN